MTKLPVSIVFSNNFLLPLPNRKLTAYGPMLRSGHFKSLSPWLMHLKKIQKIFSKCSTKIQLINIQNGSRTFSAKCFYSRNVLGRCYMYSCQIVRIYHVNKRFWYVYRIPFSSLKIPKLTYSEHHFMWLKNIYLSKAFDMIRIKVMEKYEQFWLNRLFPLHIYHSMCRKFDLK